MDFVLLVIQVAVWLAMGDGGGAPAGNGPEECVRGQIIPC